MKFSLIILLAILSCIPIAKNISFKKNVQFSEIENINYFKWINRLLIIIDEENKTTKKIRRFSKEFKERDMLIITIKENNSFINNYLMNDKFYKSVTRKIKKTDKKHNYILIGKDGTIKKTYASDTIIDKILSKVDSMPMRIKEAKKN